MLGVLVTATASSINENAFPQTSGKTSHKPEGGVWGKFRELEPGSLASLGDHGDASLQPTVVLRAVDRPQLQLNFEVHERVPEWGVHELGAVVRQNYPTSSCLGMYMTGLYQPLTALATSETLFDGRTRDHP